MASVIKPTIPMIDSASISIALITIWTVYIFFLLVIRLKRPATRCTSERKPLFLLEFSEKCFKSCDSFRMEYAVLIKIV